MKKKLLAVAAALLIIVPAFAVLSEKDLSQTLSVLRYELYSAYKAAAERSARFSGNKDRQHARLVKMMQQSNELSLMLYSQKQDYTFDMTYALNEVSKQYEEFSSRKLPFDDIVRHLDIDIDRYDRLIHTLRSLPPSSTMEYVDSAGNVVVLEAGRPRGLRPDSLRGPRPDSLRGPRPDGFPATSENQFELDSMGRIDRDSCIFYAQFLLDNCLRQKERLVRDSTSYRETADMLKSAYDYAQDRYKTVQTRIFKEGQTNYFTLLKFFPRYWKQAATDAKDKYSQSGEGARVHSQWRGPMVIGFGAFALFYLLISVLVAVGFMAIFAKRISFLRKSAITNNRFATTIIIAVVLFSLSIMIASAASTQHFFSMAAKLLIEFVWMLASILISLVIRYKDESVKKGIGLYLPVLLMCFIIIGLRIAFVPNSLMNIIFPPLLLIFAVYNAIMLKLSLKKVKTEDLVFGWVSMAVMLITLVVVFRGFVLLGVQLLIWWFFLLTLLQTIIAVYDLLNIFYQNHIRDARKLYVENHPDLPHRTDEDLIAVTWMHSLVKKSLLPIAIMMSLPLSLQMGAGVFDLTGVFNEYYAYPFLNVEGYISLSFSKIVMVIVLYFIFKYINYVAKALYRLLKIKQVLKKSEVGVFSENEVNFTLAGHVIGIILWGIYIITLFIMLKIPTTAIKVVGAGLATGLGFAMKDILNNFFYGVQLMSGRLRVGDYIECDGIRGKVDSINYQSTQIIAEDGAVMAFPNATLFNKNFKNLTRNHSYEMLKFEVGVKYGSDIEQVRQIIIDAMEPLRGRDKYGHEIVEPKFGIQVRFSGFGDNSVNLQVIQYTTVEEHYVFAAKAKEVIYNALNEHGIEIPFPQQDVYLKEMPSFDKEK
ncbi:MAG: mechanosensitive ion channel family protein [Bacteroidales bacterium]|nr:mechanosensitive ion channel family protein [Bacteroidales bacterium]